MGMMEMKMQTRNYQNYEEYYAAADFYNKLARQYPTRVAFRALGVGSRWRYRVYWW